MKLRRTAFWYESGLYAVFTDMGFEVIRKIHDQGGSFLIALPILWIRSKKLKAGDRVTLQFDDKVTIEAKEDGPQ
jgi:hypothetical protein